MSKFRPSYPYSERVELLTGSLTNQKGVNKKTYSSTNPKTYINVSWKSYGGTETTVNGVYSIVDTATLETWYRPDITAGCAVKTTDGQVYEIKGKPEDIEMRHQFLRLKVAAVEGGA